MRTHITDITGLYGHTGWQLPELSAAAKELLKELLTMVRVRRVLGPR